MLSVGIVLGMCASYFFIAYFYAWLLQLQEPKFTRAAYGSLGLIAACVVVSYIGAEVIPDEQLGNRFQHAFGGGFAAYLTCLLACRDAGFDISRLRLGVLALLVATAMGVANEILELILQSTTPYIFSANSLDTWKDLASNAAGSVAAAALLTPFWRTNNS